MKKLAGFTLIELVIVMVIIGVVATIAAPLVLNAARASAIEYNFANTISQGQNASTQITTAIRNIQNITVMSANSFTFIDNTGASISYSLSGGNLLKNSSILAQNVTSLNFSYYDNSVVATAISASVRYITYSFTVTNDSQSHTFTNSIYLRNS